MKRKMDLEDEAEAAENPTDPTEEETTEKPTDPTEEETTEHPIDPTGEEAEEEVAEHLTDPTEEEAEEETEEEAEEEAHPAAETTVRTHASEDAEIRLTDGQARALQCNRPGNTAVINEDDHAHHIEINYGKTQHGDVWWDLEGFDAGYLQQNIVLSSPAMSTGSSG